MNIGFSVDVEGGAPWNGMADAIEFLIQELSVRNGRATFFFLGELAEALPKLVTRVRNAGHEIGVHGYRHISLERHSRKAMYKDLIRAKNVIENISGVPVYGYRAPYISLNENTFWAIEILKECGFVYDSSCFLLPSNSDATEGVKKGTWVYRNGVVEIPVSSVRTGKFGFLPITGGLIRHIPYYFTRQMIKSAVNTGCATVVYTHAHELIETSRSLKILSSSDIHHSFELRVRGSPFFQTRNCGLNHKSKIHRLIQEFQCSAVCSYVAGSDYFSSHIDDT